MSMITAAVDLLLSAAEYPAKCAECERVTAERDAALARVAALEEQLQAARNDKAFYYQMATERKPATL